MTEIQKHQIQEMRRYGCTYKHIASALSLNAGTVKTYCVRAVQKGLDISRDPIANSLCKQCGTPIIQIPKRKKRIFCSKTCSQNWWNSHVYMVNRSSKALFHFTCSTCGKQFSAYGKADRKYCSHECYINDRYHGEACDGR